MFVTWMWPWTAAMHHRPLRPPLTSLNHLILNLTSAFQRTIQENNIHELTVIDCLYNHLLETNSFSTTAPTSMPSIRPPWTSSTPTLPFPPHSLPPHQKNKSKAILTHHLMPVSRPQTINWSICTNLCLIFLFPVKKKICSFALKYVHCTILG